MERASWRLAGRVLSCPGVGFAPFPLRIFAESFDNVGSASAKMVRKVAKKLDEKTKPSETEEISLCSFRVHEILQKTN